MNSLNMVIRILYLIIILGILVPGVSFADTTTVDQVDRVPIYFFYDIHCDSCINVMSYLMTLSSAYPEIQIFSYDTCLKNLGNQPNITLYTSFKNERGIPNAEVPVVALGSTVLEGEENITRTLQSVIQTKLGLDVSSPRVPVPVVGEVTPVQLPEVPQVDLFYDSDCATCMNTKTFVEKLAPSYPDIQFQYHDICGRYPEGKQNRDLFRAFLLKHGVSDNSAPAVFFGDVVLQGEGKITQDLERTLQAPSTQKSPLNVTPLYALALMCVLLLWRRR